jgi:hypothetical protein
MARTTEPDAKQWLFAMILFLGQQDLTWCLVTLWTIWFARRKANHEGAFQSPLSTLNFVESFIRDLEISAAKKKTASTTVVKSGSGRWVPPDAGYTKINVDAAV